MMIYLKTTGIWSVIEGPSLQGNADRAVREKNDLGALTILVQTVSSSETGYAIKQITAKPTWDKLEQVKRGRVVKKISFQHDLNTVKWKKGETATDCMHCAKYLGDQLRSPGENLEDAELAAIAVLGLQKGYGVAWSFNICANAGVTPDKVRYALLGEEQRLNSFLTTPLGIDHR